MKMTASRRLLCVVNFTTWMPSGVFCVSTGVMLSGMGRPNGTLRSSLAIAGEAGGEVGAGLGHADVVIGLGEVPTDAELPLLLHPTTADSTTATAATGTTFTTPRYATGNDTICW